MYSLLIVDDEELAREGLKEYFLKTGLFDIDLAKDGYEALEKIEAGRYDVIIIDIIMPNMNGLELLQKIKDMEPSPVKIILSGYSKFEYAKEAYTYGIQDFLVKPVTEKMVEEVTDKVIYLIRERSHAETKKSEISSYLETVKLERADRFLERLINASMTPEDIKEGLKEYHIVFRHPQFRVAVSSIQIIGSMPGYNREILNRMVIDMFQTYGNESLTVRGFELVSSKLGLIFNYDIGHGSDIEDAILSVQMEINSLFHSDVIVGVGEKVFDVSMLNKSFLEAKSAYESGKSMQGLKTLYYSDLGEKYDELSASIDYEDVYSALKEGRVDEITSRIKQLFEQKYSALPSPRLLRLGVAKIVLACQVLCAQYESDMNETLSQPVMSLLYRDSAVSTDDIIRDINALLLDVNQKMNRKKHEQNNQFAGRALQIIDERYMEHIYVGSIADELGLSNNYMGKLFRDYTGMSFTAYLNNKRVEKARELLEDNSLKIYEVGDKVGYSDQHYFCVVFKKIVGVSPSEYRDMVNQSLPKFS